RVRLVHDLLAQRLPDPLHRAALELADDDHGIDHPAHVVAGRVRDDVRDAGLGIDLDLADMAAVRPGRPAHRGRRIDVDRLARLARGELEQADAAIGADDGEARVAVLDVAGGYLESLGGELAGMVDGLPRAALDGRAAGEQRAGARAAEAVGAVGVALDDADAVDRHAEGVDRELGIAGGDALAHRLGGGNDLDVAVRRDAHAHVLLEGVAAGPFEEGGEAAPAQHAAGGRLRRPFLEAVPVGERHALVEDGLEAAAVVHLPHGVGIGHLLGPDHVAAADLALVDPGDPGCLVHEPLDDVDVLGPAGAPVGAGGGGMGKDRLQLQVDHA